MLSELKKITKEKISSEFISKVAGSDQMNEDQKKAQAIISGVVDEAERDLEQIKDLNKQLTTKQGEADF